MFGLSFKGPLYVNLQKHFSFLIAFKPKLSEITENLTEELNPLNIKYIKHSVDI